MTKCSKSRHLHYCNDDTNYYHQGSLDGNYYHNRLDYKQELLKIKIENISNLDKIEDKNKNFYISLHAILPLINYLFF